MAVSISMLLIVGGVGGCLEPTPSHSVSYGGGAIEVQNGKFVMNGTVTVGSGATRNQNFSDVAVVLYNEEKEVIRRVLVGTLSTHPEYYPTHREVNITSETVPKYVVLGSPDFWTSETALEVEGYESINGTYYRYPVSENIRFPEE